MCVELNVEKEQKVDKEMEVNHMTDFKSNQ